MAPGGGKHGLGDAAPKWRVALLQHVGAQPVKLALAHATPKDVGAALVLVVARHGVVDAEHVEQHGHVLARLFRRPFGQVGLGREHVATRHQQALWARAPLPLYESGQARQACVAVARTQVVDVAKGDERQSLGGSGHWRAKCAVREARSDHQGGQCDLLLFDCLFSFPPFQAVPSFARAAVAGPDWARLDGHWADGAAHRPAARQSKDTSTSIGPTARGAGTRPFIAVAPALRVASGHAEGPGVGRRPERLPTARPCRSPRRICGVTRLPFFTIFFAPALSPCSAVSQKTKIAGWSGTIGAYPQALGPANGLGQVCAWSGGGVWTRQNMGENAATRQTKEVPCRQRHTSGAREREKRCGQPYQRRDHRRAAATTIGNAKARRRTERGASRVVWPRCPSNSWARSSTVATATVVPLWTRAGAAWRAWRAASCAGPSNNRRRGTTTRSATLKSSFATRW